MLKCVRGGVELALIDRHVFGASARRHQVDERITATVKSHQGVDLAADETAVHHVGKVYINGRRLHAALGDLEDACRHLGRKRLRAPPVATRAHLRGDVLEGRYHAAPRPWKAADNLEVEAARALVPEEREVGGAQRPAAAAHRVSIGPAAASPAAPSSGATAPRCLC